jgi:hypothetical protein
MWNAAWSATAGRRHFPAKQSVRGGPGGTENPVFHRYPHKRQNRRRYERSRDAGPYRPAACIMKNL